MISVNAAKAERNNRMTQAEIKAFNVLKVLIMGNQLGKLVLFLRLQILYERC